MACDKWAGRLGGKGQLWRLAPLPWHGILLLRIVLDKLYRLLDKLYRLLQGKYVLVK